MNIPRLVFAALGLVCGGCCAWQMHVQRQLLLLKEEVSGEFSRLIPRVIAASSTFFIVTNVVEIVALLQGSTRATLAIADFSLGCCTLMGAYRSHSSCIQCSICICSHILHILSLCLCLSLCLSHSVSVSLSVTVSI